VEAADSDAVRGHAIEHAGAGFGTLLLVDIEHAVPIRARQRGDLMVRAVAPENEALAVALDIERKNFTAAAHEAGFADQAHFARDFRRTFGAPATPSLAKVRGAAISRWGYCAEAALSGGLIDQIQPMIFHMSSLDFTMLPWGGIGPTTFSEPFRT